jgi:hypothetical protein
MPLMTVTTAIITVLHSAEVVRIPHELRSNLSGCSMNRSLDLGMMSTTGFRSPPNKALNCRNPPNAVPNPSPQISILHTNREQRLTG